MIIMFYLVSYHIINFFLFNIYMDISLGVQYYNDLKHIIFNNLILVLIFIYIYYYYGVNTFTIISTPIILLLYYVIKQFSRKFNILGPIHTQQCLNYSNRLIIDSRVKPIETRPDLLDTKFSEFLVNSSHNSYLPCTQHIDVASLDAILHTIKMGARVIELDCFMRNNKTNDIEPVVTHGKEGGNNSDIFVTNYILFEDCIKLISEHAFNTSDPLILTLELNTNRNEKTHQRMIDIIKQYLGNRLLTPEFKMNSNNRRYFNDVPIRNLLNKVIILTGGGITENIREILDGSFTENLFGNTSNRNNNIIKQNISNRVIQRIYPAGDLFGHFSYNFDPEPFWNVGCQMVALNFNKVDRNLLKNYEKFRDYSFVKKN